MENNKSEKPYFVHQLADIQTENVGENTRIWQFVVVLKGAKIGKNCNLNCHTFIENDVVLGDGVTIKSGVYLWDGISIGNNVFIGPSVTFVNNPYPKSMQYPDKHIGATIENNVSIGANATIMGNITICEGAMIGAASMITKNVPAYTLWYGNPAKQQGYVTENGTVLSLSLIDKKTGNQYKKNASGKPELVI